MQFCFERKNVFHFDIIEETTVDSKQGNRHQRNRQRRILVLFQQFGNAGATVELTSRRFVKIGSELCERCQFTILRQVGTNTAGEALDRFGPVSYTHLQDDAFIPVISPIGFSDDGQAYNINADVVAGEIAQILRAEKLIMMTNTSGVLDKQNRLLTDLTAREIEMLFEDGTISGGMLPKIGSALDAAKSGVNSVHTIDGRIEHSLLLEILTEQPFGTLIRSH